MSRWSMARPVWLAAAAMCLLAVVVAGCKSESAGPQQPTPTAVVNVKCPIMGGAIDPAKVTAGLTRVYKSQKVAFCCAGCPESWDKLADADKATKLAAAMPAKK